MAREYNKIDYANFDSSKYTTDDLQKLIDKMASAVTARLKKAGLVTGYQGSSFWTTYVLRLEQRPEYFNDKTNRPKRSVKSLNRTQLEEYSDILADLMQIEIPRVEFEEMEKIDDMHKALSNIRKQDPEKFLRLIRIARNKPIEDDEEYTDGSPDDETVEDIKEVYESEYTVEDYQNALEQIVEEDRKQKINEIKEKGTEAYIDLKTGQIKFK